MPDRQQPVNAVLVDLDGVLRHWPDAAYLIEDSHGLPQGIIAKTAFALPRLMPAIRGSILDAEWRKSLSTELLRAYPQSDACTAVRLWSESAGELDFPAVQAISKYAAQVQIVLATNATSRLNSDLNVLGIHDLFFGIANSSELGVVKPEPAFYRAALEIADSNAEQTLYIDDTLENVQAAMAMGICSHHFNDVRNMEIFLSRYI